jgi:hypothetical protein
MKKPVATSDVKAIAAYYMIEKAKELLHEPAQPCSCPATGSADLLEAMRHHEEMASVRLQHAQELRERIAKMDADETLRPQYDSPWEKTKSHNLKQADFDEEWGKKHQRFAAAICSAINPPNE